MINMMDYKILIDKYYPEDDDLKALLMKHSRQVADKCILACERHPELQLDRAFVEEAAMLHDIGIRWCHAPGIFCEGEEPYIRHGLIGGEILRKEGFPQHARVCERHTGTGLTREQIIRQKVCYADKFFSKSHSDRVLSVADAARSLEKFGHEGVEKFLEWAKKFE